MPSRARVSAVVPLRIPRRALDSWRRTSPESADTNGDTAQDWNRTSAAYRSALAAEVEEFEGSRGALASEVCAPCRGWPRMRAGRRAATWLFFVVFYLWCPSGDAANFRRQAWTQDTDLQGIGTVTKQHFCFCSELFGSRKKGRWTLHFIWWNHFPAGFCSKNVSQSDGEHRATSIRAIIRGNEPHHAHIKQFAPALGCEEPLADVWIGHDIFARKVAFVPFTMQQGGFSS